MRTLCRLVFLGVSAAVLSGPFLLFAEGQLPTPELERAGMAVGKIENDNFAGSGFFLEDGKTFVTAFHVMERLLDEAPFHSLTISQGDRQYKPRRINRLSSLHDLAFLEVEGYEGPVLKLSEPPNPCKGEAYIMGFSSGEWKFYALKGRILACESDQYLEFIGDTASMLGFSGGPVLNSKGQVIGAVSYGFSNLIFAVRDTVLRNLFNLGPLKEKDSASPERLVKSEMQNLEKQAMDGHALAQYRLSLLLNRIDRESAVRWLEQSAEGNFPPAQSDFGLALLRGNGVPQDKRKAADLFERSAERGFPPAKVHLGSLLREGEGRPQDTTKALDLYKSAAEQGFAPAQFQMGWILREGPGALQEDKEEAAYWYEMAAQGGFPPAQIHLAEMLRTGEGIPQDIGKSLYLMRLSRQRNR